MIKFYGNSNETYAVTEGKIFMIQSVNGPIYTPIDFTAFGMPSEAEEVADLTNDPDYVEIVKMCLDATYTREDLYDFHLGENFQTITLS